MNLEYLLTICDNNLLDIDIYTADGKTITLETFKRLYFYLKYDVLAIKANEYGKLEIYLDNKINANDFIMLRSKE